MTGIIEEALLGNLAKKVASKIDIDEIAESAAKNIGPIIVAGFTRAIKEWDFRDDVSDAIPYDAISKLVKKKIAAGLK